VPGIKHTKRSAIYRALFRHPRGKAPILIVMGQELDNYIANALRSSPCLEVIAFGSSTYTPDERAQCFSVFERAAFSQASGGIKPEQTVLMYVGSGIRLDTVLETLRGSSLRLAVDGLCLELKRTQYTNEELDQAIQNLRILGLVEEKRTEQSGVLTILFQRPAHYKDVELERERLGGWGQPSAPRYSICVCNYNMSDTLERSMRSIVGQLDERFEVLVIDDGSNDESLDILEHLSKKFDNFRYISLPRDRKRLLGETRNISIRAARGEYVLLHIDADDEWEPYLHDFVTLFHKIEEAAGHDIHLSGQQTGMGKRNLLLSYGPYENIYRCEDRNLMMKLASRNILMLLDYKVYRTRMSRPAKKKVIKVITDNCSQLMFEMRQNEKKARSIFKFLLAPIVGGQFSFKIRLLRAFAILPIYIISRFKPPIINDMTWQELRDYHATNRGTYAELMTRMGGDPDLSFLSKDSQEIYSYDVRLPGFQSTR